jgi:hypothetical protein
MAGGLSFASAQPLTYSISYNSGFNNGGVVPDGNVTGWSDTRIISGLPDVDYGTPEILDVNVFLALNGGYNGDLYGYLVHSTGFAVLLNRPGVQTGNAFGYGDAGMNVKFDDTAANGNIHFYQLSGSYPAGLMNGSSWAPDGRNVNPASVNGTESPTSLLASFNGTDVNGSWTLFLADLSVGETSTVASWGVEVVVAPEPSTWVLLTLGAVCGGWRFFRRRSQ